MTDCTLDASLSTEIGFRYPGLDEAVLQEGALLANRSFLEFVRRVRCFMESFESLNRLAELINVKCSFGASSRPSIRLTHCKTGHKYLGCIGFCCQW